MTPELPSCLAHLLSDGHVPRSQASRRTLDLLKPLFAGGVLDHAHRGRGETIVVKDAGRLREWTAETFPASAAVLAVPIGAARAVAISRRRDSKAGNQRVARSALLFRAPGAQVPSVSIDGVPLPAVDLTTRFGLAACLVGDDTQLSFSGTVALVENLEAFLHAERLLPAVSLFFWSAGRISERLVRVLGRADWGQSPLWHLPDYDPVGLEDFRRLEVVLDKRVQLFVPTDLKERFHRFGNHKLIADKPRNRELLERLGKVTWQSPDAKTVFNLIRETGCGLEQEALLIDAKF